MDFKNLHALFEAQVQKSPDAIALQLENDCLTDQELNERANQLANYLLKTDIISGELIGLLIESSFEVIIGMLGILKSGAAYVPINLLFPEKRIESILEDTKVNWVLTLDNLRDKLPTSYKNRVLCLDGEKHLWSSENKDNLSLDVPTENTAYVAYTSGSTGIPKGVLVKHLGAVNFLQFLSKEYPIDSNDTTLQIIPFCFDGSVREVFGTLINGARLVMLKEPKVNNASAIIAVTEAFKKYNITLLLSMVPAVLKHIVKLAKRKNQRFESVKLILLAGEAIYYSYIIDIKNAFSEKTTVICQYGLTETSMVASYYVVNEIKDKDEKVPIGKPVYNTYFYILDKNLNSVSQGKGGDIYIGGLGIAEYLNQEKSNRERFLIDPFQGDPQKRLCRTGDIGKFLSDGNVVFMGRNDDMVVFDGYRIELGEIERVIEKNSNIQGAAVAIYEDEFSNKYLNCYYIVSINNNIPPEELLIYAKKVLPHYMIPSTFIQLDSFPLKPNGKLDRKALSKL